MSAHKRAQEVNLKVRLQRLVDGQVAGLDTVHTEDEFLYSVSMVGE